MDWVLRRRRITVPANAGDSRSVQFSQYILFNFFSTQGGISYTTSSRLSHLGLACYIRDPVRPNKPGVRLAVEPCRFPLSLSSWCSSRCWQLVGNTQAHHARWEINDDHRPALRGKTRPPARRLTRRRSQSQLAAGCVLTSNPPSAGARRRGPEIRRDPVRW